MYESPRKDLLEIQVDEKSREYLLEASKWARFISITGLVIAGLLLIFTCYSMWRGGTLGSPAYAIGSFVGALLFIGLYVYPLITILRFSSGVRNGLVQMNQSELKEGMRYLKLTFRFLGVLLILLIIFYIFLAIFTFL